MKRFAPLLIIAAACLWGTMGLFVRRLNVMGLEAMEIVEVRSMIATVILFPCTALRDRKLLGIRPRNIWPLVGTGIFSMVFFNFCYFSTIARMNLSAAAILLYTSPIFVMLLSLPLFHERLTAKKLAAHMTEKLHCDGFNILQNNGEAAGQTVFHFHVHLIPRYLSDPEHINWKPGPADPEELKKIYAEITG